MNILLNEHRFLGKAVEFFRVCLEGCLLTKEEGLLFAKLQMKGFPRQGGVSSLMLIDHERGRRLISEMGKAAANYEAGDSGAGDRWAAAALDLVELMRAHLREEEGSLFMMADNFLQPPEQAELADELKKFEAAQAISGRHNVIHRMPDE